MKTVIYKNLVIELHEEAGQYAYVVTDEIGTVLSKSSYQFTLIDEAEIAGKIVINEMLWNKKNK